MSAPQDSDLRFYRSNAPEENGPNFYNYSPVVEGELMPKPKVITATSSRCGVVRAVVRGTDINGNQISEIIMIPEGKVEATGETVWKTMTAPVSLEPEDSDWKGVISFPLPSYSLRQRISDGVTSALAFSKRHWRWPVCGICSTIGIWGTSVPAAVLPFLLGALVTLLLGEYACLLMDAQKQPGEEIEVPFDAEMVAGLKKRLKANPNGKLPLVVSNHEEWPPPPRSTPVYP